MTPSTGGGRIWRRLGVAAILFTSIWFTYRSSLAHAPRSDQWSFLLDTIDQRGFVETFRHTYSYNRTREAGPGDYQLFRPVLFAFLSAEKALFDNNFAGWQWVGIILHFLAAYLALQVMLRIQRLVGSGATTCRRQILRRTTNCGLCWSRSREGCLFASNTLPDRRA